MRTNSFNSMSIEELWSIHEQVESDLSCKVLKEKIRLERQVEPT
jgi:hypothetical protein